MNQLRCVEIGYGSAAYEAGVTLRSSVLRAPLGMEFSRAELERESSQHHLACYRDGKLVACLLLVPGAGGEIRMRQVAVRLEMQGQGVGSALVGFAEEHAKARRFSRMTLHARESALPFYAKLGYQRVGSRFLEIQLPHWEMRKSL